MNAATALVPGAHAQMLTSGERTFAPAFITAVYAYGVTRQIMAGYFGWVVLIVAACGFGLALFWLPARSEGTPSTPPGE